MDPNISHDPKVAKKHQPSNSELFSNAKLVAEAATSTFGHESEKVDKAKVAGAAANLLGAASRHGKLEEKNYGKYVNKAETYLHKYHVTHSTTTTTTETGHKTTVTTHTETETYSTSGGDYLKKAQGFLKK